MHSYPNIDRSAFNARSYVGYASYRGNAIVYRITRSGSGWRAVAQAPGFAAPVLTQPTLRQMSDSLSDLALTGQPVGTMQALPLPTGRFIVAAILAGGDIRPDVSPGLNGQLGSFEWKGRPHAATLYYTARDAEAQARALNS